MFPIDQVVTRGWPLLQAILKPGPEVNTDIWAQLPKSILKGKGVDPLERGGAMEASGSKVEGKQVSDGNQGGKGGEKGKKKEKKEKKEKKIERVEKGSDGGQESRVVGSESGGPISGGDLEAGTAKEHRGQTWERKPKKHSRTQSQSQSVVSKPQKIIDSQDQVQPKASTSSNPTATQALPETPSPHPFNNSCNHYIWQTKDCTRRLEKGIPVGACLPCRQGKSSPGTSKGSIPRPFQRPNSSIHSGDFKAAGYPLEADPKLGTWPFPIKEGQGLSLQIKAEDAFAHPKGKIQ
ncbi:hypothetical protein PAXRUDRAFT_22817 [Paxillus rubicundulus Ve08.2h10]|uniref:Unplaced genomic scaffold scaffold_6824, whole genome shotgun sequence n=1 Tax=Paxillus rubicundulus Ve08.2h10 TaxID=930991 RepID=A0A0D0C823_9AGAM|nr:hypothetical protein PAXRUDRAFT_22817 [Paxillus rubicundulus Ve08.2h10]